MARPHPRRQRRECAQGGAIAFQEAGGHRLPDPGKRQVKRLLATLALILLVAPALCLMAPSARAANIQNIDLGKRAEVWFAEDHTVPIVSFNISLPAGSAYDPAGKAGLCAFPRALVGEG